MSGLFSKGSKESAKLPIPQAPPAPSGREVPREHKHAPAPVREIEEDSRGTPPLFIKIDKYGDVVKNVQRLKSFALGLRDALDALSDIEKELSTGLTIANRALDNFNTTITMIDAKLLRVAGTTEMDKDIEVPEELDAYVKNIYDQMSQLKHQLKTIE